jgi:SlyX protein
MEDRIAELELKLTFCEDLLEELNRLVYRQQQQIEQLQKETRELREQMRASLPAEPRTPGEDKPPHY